MARPSSSFMSKNGGPVGVAHVERRRGDRIADEEQARRAGREREGASGRASGVGRDEVTRSRSPRGREALHVGRDRREHPGAFMKAAALALGQARSCARPTSEVPLGAGTLISALGNTSSPARLRMRRCWSPWKCEIRDVGFKRAGVEAGGAKLRSHSPCRARRLAETVCRGGRGGCRFRPQRGEVVEGTARSAGLRAQRRFDVRGRHVAHQTLDVRAAGRSLR